jgi:alkylation response protein AidB-like acyl-CoA dehydrogenase
MRSYAAPKDDHFVLNGTKTFITSAPYADVIVVWAITDRNAKKSRALSAFILEQGTSGYSIGKAEEKMGQRGSATNELVFEDCKIPRENLLGELNAGYRIALMELSGGRIGIGSLAIGVGRAAMDFATSYAKERIQFSQPIASFQAIQAMIADAYTELEAAQLLVLRAAWLKESGKPYAKEAAMGKLYATEAANRACYRAVQILGGYGYVREYPVERYYRDARVTTLYEGTSEIQRIIIARFLLDEAH